MDFKIRDCKLEDFLTTIRKIEMIKKPFNRGNYEVGQREDKNLTWEKLEKNTQKNGKPIFKLQLRGEEDLMTKAKIAIVDKVKEMFGGDSRGRIPLGNYYIEFYYYRATGRQIVGSVDLKWNKNGKIMKRGYHPLFCFEKIFRSTKAQDDNTLELFSVEEILKMAVQDRLNQICAKKDALPEASLLADTISYVFKFSEDFVGSRENYRTKILNRVILIPLSKINDGKWAFDWSKNPRGNFSDALNHDESVNIDLLHEMVDYFEETDGEGLVLGEASEEGGQKGNLVFLNKDLQKLRRPGQRTYEANYEDILYGEVPGREGVVYSIYHSVDKFFARIKSFVTSDGCIANNLEAQKLDLNEEVVFDRHKVYLANRPIKYGKVDPSTINMLVAYVPTDDRACDMTMEQFRDCNKAEYSKLLNMTDCYLPISEEAGSTLVTVRRKISEPITEKHFSYELRDVIKKLETEGPQVIPPDMPIGYSVTCQHENCLSIMSPVKFIKDKEGDLVPIDIQGDKDVREWFCDVCGSDINTEPKVIRVCNKFQNATEIKINHVEVDDVESSISIDAEIACPIAIARGVSVEGIKGLTLPTNQDFIGYVDGEIYNPETDQMEDISYMPIDMLVPLGSMKGKLSGVSVSHLRLINALTNSNICPDERYRTEGSIESTNQLLSNCKKVTLRRRNYNPDTNKFDWEEKEVHIGIVSLNITEIGDEFLKVKTEIDDMKVSYMNALYYNWLGFDDLNKAMVKSSLVGMEKEGNKKFISELLKMFYSDPDGLIQLEDKDFDNKKGSINIVSWLEKAEWTEALEHHPMLEVGGKFENGAYYKDKYGNIIVFPSRETIMRLVDVMNGNRVRLNSIVKDILRIYLDCYRFQTTRKMKSYKDNIYKKLTGKQGVFARSATFVNFGCSGKEVGSGYLPPGVAVIGNSQFWNVVKKQCIKLEIDYKAIRRGDVNIYGTSQRDPFIWLFQALNSVQLWTVDRANRYFKKQYGTRFDEIYPNFNGIMLNTLDMLYLYQTDADGDLRRILVPFDIEAQSRLATLNKDMENYNLICQSSPDTIIGNVYQSVESWHFNYVLKEAEGSSEDFGDKLNITIKSFMSSERNKMIIKSIKAKGNVGIITTSQWKIQALCDYFVKTQTGLIVDPAKPLVVLTPFLRNRICVFYQTVFTQDGCVRSMKGDKDLSKCSLDELANNGQTSWVDKETAQEKVGTVQDMVRDEAIKNGYEDIIDIFFAVCNEWMIMGGITEENGKVAPNLEQMSPQAEMINAYISMCNGSKYMSIDRSNMFERFVEEGSEALFERELISSLVPYLQKIKLSKQ